MISIKKSQMPQYLKNSEFYKSLEDKGILEIPKNLFKKNVNVKNISDFVHLLNTVQYFGIEYPNTLYKYYQNNSYKVLDFYDIESPDKIDFFKRLLDLQIKNFEQFESNMRIYELYGMDYSNEFIEHAFNNKRLYLKNDKFRYEKLKEQLIFSEEWIIKISEIYDDDEKFYIYKLEEFCIIEFELIFFLNGNFLCSRYVEYAFEESTYKNFQKYLKEILSNISGSKKENYSYDPEKYENHEGFVGFEIEYDNLRLLFGEQNPWSNDRKRDFLLDHKKYNFDVFSLNITNFNKQKIYNDMKEIIDQMLKSIEKFLLL